MARLSKKDRFFCCRGVVFAIQAIWTSTKRRTRVQVWREWMAKSRLVTNWDNTGKSHLDKLLWKTHMYIYIYICNPMNHIHLYIYIYILTYDNIYVHNEHTWLHIPVFKIVPHTIGQNFRFCGRHVRPREKTSKQEIGVRFSGLACKNACTFHFFSQKCAYWHQNGRVGSYTHATRLAPAHASPCGVRVSAYSHIWDLTANNERKLTLAI